MFDVYRIRNDFPQLTRQINGKPLVYLDSTATSLKPQSVIDKENEYYLKYSANVFRGIYVISEEATAAYEGARKKIATFIGVHNENEVIFTRNASESINLVYYSWAKSHIGKGDEVVTTIMEHHSNFVPWQQLAAQNKATLKIWNTNPYGLLDLNDLNHLITPQTKLFTITAVSNVLGTINPISQIIRIVKKLNPHCLVLVDAAQAVPHQAVNVVQWGADFVAFSGHKMLGPTGIGVLWGKEELLNSMDPFIYGGEMISEVHVNHSLYKQAPHKFEAGTPHIAGAIGLGAAVDYLTHLGMESVRQHEEEIVTYALKEFRSFQYLKVLGSQESKLRGGVIAFTMEGVHPHDIAQVLDTENVCVRSGNHCAMPLHEFYKISSTARASFYVYTTKEDIDMLMVALEKAKKTFQ